VGFDLYQPYATATFRFDDGFVRETFGSEPA